MRIRDITEYMGLSHDRSIGSALGELEALNIIEKRVLPSRKGCFIRVKNENDWLINEETKN